MAGLGGNYADFRGKGGREELVGLPVLGVP